MYDVLHSPLVKIVAANACPTVTATPETVKAAFTKENDVFAEHNVKYIDPVLEFRRPQTFRLPDAAGLAACAWAFRRRKRSRRRSPALQALNDYEASIRTPRPRSARSAGAGRPHRHRHAGAAVSPRSRLESRNSRRIPEAGLSDLLAEHASAR